MYKNKLFSDSKRHPKIMKSREEIGVYVRVLHLSPARSSGIANLCPMASEGCEAACLHYSGHLTKRKFNARIEKTEMFIKHRLAFMNRLAKEIYNTRMYANRKGLRCGIRLNGTSDIRWESIKTPDGKNLMELFPDMQFYDYTKIANRKNIPDNYKLTFSRSENNDKDCLKALENGMNVAVVFDLPHGLPKKFMGIPVIDGDVHDFRYDDPYPCIVGLKSKGKKAEEDRTGFIFRH